MSPEPSTKTAKAPISVADYHDLKLHSQPEPEAWITFSEKYDDKVFSFTRYEKNRQIILQSLVLSCDENEPTKILNMGTGPTAHLNREFLKTGATVVATDFCQAMLDNASQKLIDDRLEYKLADSRSLDFAPTFDNVVAINSILPTCREDVVEMFASARNVLKPGGRFIATLLPHDDALYMVRYISNDWEIVDSENKIEKILMANNASMIQKLFTQR